MGEQQTLMNMVGTVISSAADLMEHLVGIIKKVEEDNETLRKENQQLKERLDGIERCKAR